MSAGPQDAGVPQHDLLGAYAVDALDDLERRAFERHLAGCAECARELPGLLATAAAIGAAEAAPPPGALRERVLAAAAATPQERILATAAVPVPSPRRSRWTARWPAAAASLLLLASAGLGVGLAVTSSRLDDARQEAGELRRTLDELTVARSMEIPSGGRLEVTSGAGAAMVRLAGVSDPAQGMTYQLWLVPAAGDPVPSVLLPDGDTTAYVEQMGEAAAVAVTMEPQGGSTAPTTEPLAVLPLQGGA
jgi:anti-sigma factor RsiW